MFFQKSRLMRIWSLHPQYLDTKWLVALWREALLAKHVLEGKTKGYKNHPQLHRFKAAKSPLDAINQYLSIVYQEAETRGYRFSRGKINWEFTSSTLTVTDGQVAYETQHLLKKLKTRDPERYEANKNIQPKIHPSFEVIPGEIEDWEIV